MAHHCDICGVLCHCGGDTDDLVNDDSPEAMVCEHCAPGDTDPNDDYEEF